MKKFNDMLAESFKYSEGFLNAFKKVNLGVLEIKESTWLQGLLLEDENELKEFRVYLGKYYSEEKFQDDWGNYLDKEEEYQEDIDEDRKRIGKLEELDGYNSDSLEFSVFLPSSVKFHDKDSPKYDMFVTVCLTQAAIYFKILENVPKTFDSPILDIEHMDPVVDDPKLFGVFLKLHGYQITNYNIDKVHEVLYRLYKDSKFFYNLKETLVNNEYKWLMDEFSKIVK